MININSIWSFIISLYEELLNRAPSENEIEQHILAVESSNITLGDLLRRFTRSHEYQSLSSQSFINAQDQFGEISLLLKEWAKKSVEHCIVVDVGARDKERSNSYDLLKFFGWLGLLIEANDALAEDIRSDFDGLEFALEVVAVSDYEGEAEFTIGVNDDVSSLSETAAGSWGASRGTNLVKVRRLSGILADHEIPFNFGFLSIDIEGEDIKVFNDLLLNSKYRPDYIIIEA